MVVVRVVHTEAVVVVTKLATILTIVKILVVALARRTTAKTCLYHDHT